MLKHLAELQDFVDLVEKWNHFSTKSVGWWNTGWPNFPSNTVNCISCECNRNNGNVPRYIYMATTNQPSAKHDQIWSNDQIHPTWSELVNPTYEIVMVPYSKVGRWGWWWSGAWVTRCRFVTWRFGIWSFRKNNGVGEMEAKFVWVTREFVHGKPRKVATNSVLFCRDLRSLGDEFPLDESAQGEPQKKHSKSQSRNGGINMYCCKTMFFSSKHEKSQANNWEKTLLKSHSHLPEVLVCFCCVWVWGAGTIQWVYVVGEGGQETGSDLVEV